MASTTSTTPAPGPVRAEGEKGDEDTVINVGTRRSALAMKQAELVVAALRAAHPGAAFRIHGMATAGDRDTGSPLQSLGKGLWTSELEARLLAGELDVLVHCVKDMPTSLPAGCVLGAVTEREDPRDVVVFPLARPVRQRGAGEEEEKGENPTAAAAAAAAAAARGPPARRLADLPPGSVVGTSSVRRAAQLRRRYPGLRFADVRGNIHTRMHKMDEPEAFDVPAGEGEGDGGGEGMTTGGGLGAGGVMMKRAPRYDCIILAAAGLLRMGLRHRIFEYLGSSPSGEQQQQQQQSSGREEGRGEGQFPSMLYAVGQGALGLELRAGDERVARIVGAITHARTAIACAAERSLMRTLEGGCSVPIGVETAWLGAGPDSGEGDGEGKPRLRLRATVTSLDGSEAVDGEMTEELSSAEEAEELGRKMAQDLTARGAQKILDRINEGREGAGAVKMAEAA